MQNIYKKYQQVLDDLEYDIIKDRIHLVAKDGYPKLNYVLILNDYFRTLLLKLKAK